MNQSDAPAFPFEGGQNNGYEPHSGMSIREYFVCQAMKGLLSGGYCIDDPRNRLEDVSSEAIAIADTILTKLHVE